MKHWRALLQCSLASTWMWWIWQGCLWVLPKNAKPVERLALCLVMEYWRLVSCSQTCMLSVLQVLVKVLIQKPVWTYCQLINTMSHSVVSICSDCLICRGLWVRAYLLAPLWTVNIRQWQAMVAWCHHLAPGGPGCGFSESPRINQSQEFCYLQFSLVLVWTCLLWLSCTGCLRIFTSL